MYQLHRSARLPAGCFRVSLGKKAGQRTEGTKSDSEGQVTGWRLRAGEMKAEEGRGGGMDKPVDCCSFPYCMTTLIPWLKTRARCVSFCPSAGPVPNKRDPVGAGNTLGAWRCLF